MIGTWSEVTDRRRRSRPRSNEAKRLNDAIETISEGFSLDDADDRLVLGIQKYAELFDVGEGPPAPGSTYEEIVRKAVAHGLIADARGREEGWIRQRLDGHRHPGAPMLQRGPTAAGSRSASAGPRGGGTVAVYSDLTELKGSEQRAAAANRTILESLRYASRIQAAVLPAPEELERRDRGSFPDLGAARHRRRRFLLVPGSGRVHVRSATAPAMACPGRS